MKKNPITIADLEARVAKGVEYLNLNYPQWQTKIDLSAFNINNCRQCIFGQLLENYWKLEMEDPEVYHKAYLYGFDLIPSHLDEVLVETTAFNQYGDPINPNDNIGIDSYTLELQRIWVRTINNLQTQEQGESNVERQ
jgi:hypothetical protein